MKAKGFGLISFFFITLLVGCTSQPGTERVSTATPTPTQPTITATSVSPTSTPQSNILTITGVINTIWNGGAHYSITTEEGKRYQLQLDVELTKPLGGPLSIDRQRMTITGELINDDPPTILVLSIEFAK